VCCKEYRRVRRVLEGKTFSRGAKGGRRLIS
jgi:hypothetical protein